MFLSLSCVTTRGDFEGVLSELEQGSGAQMKEVPLARLLSNADIAIAGSAQSPRVDSSTLFNRVSDRLGPKWQQIVRTQSGHESTVTYATQRSSLWSLIIVSINAMNMTLVHTDLDIHDLQKWIVRPPTRLADWLRPADAHSH